MRRHGVLEASNRIDLGLHSADFLLNEDDEASWVGFAWAVTRLGRPSVFWLTRSEKRDTVLTAGPIQSNHARVIAAAARRFSVDCHLFLTGPLGRWRENRSGGIGLYFAERLACLGLLYGGVFADF